MTNLVYVLISPQMPENVGAVARAMANFGLKELRLVTPHCSVIDEKAIAMAAGADEILRQAQVFDSFEAAIADLNWIYGTCATERQLIKRYIPARLAMEEIKNADVDQIGVIFGPERTGLSNEILARCQAIIQIPVQTDFSSLNLAQAAVVLSYEWLQAQIQVDEAFVMGETMYASQGQITAFLNDLEKRLDDVSFWRIAHKKPIMWQNTQNIFARMTLTAQDVRTLWGMMRSLFEYKHEQEKKDDF